MPRLIIHRRFDPSVFIPMKLLKLLKNPPDWLALVMLTVGIVAYLVGLGILRNFIHS